MNNFDFKILLILFFDFGFRFKNPFIPDSINFTVSVSVYSTYGITKTTKICTDIDVTYNAPNMYLHVPTYMH